jgi:hypothetical protein
VIFIFPEVDSMRKQVIFISKTALVPVLPVRAKLSYYVTDLGALPGAAESKTRAINKLGQIEGYEHEAEGDLHACLFDITGSGNPI